MVIIIEATHYIDIRLGFNGNILWSKENVQGAMLALNVNDPKLIMDSYTKNFFLHLKEFIDANYSGFKIEEVSLVPNVIDQEDPEEFEDDEDEEMADTEPMTSLDSFIINSVRSKLEELGNKNGELTKVSLKHYTKETSELISKEFGIPNEMIVNNPIIDEECEIEYIIFEDDKKTGGTI